MLYKNYDKYRYIYPPRPATVAPSEALSSWRSGWVAQPKLNGSCCIVATNGTDLVVNNRHNSTFARMKLETSHLKRLSKNGKWVVIVGEYMNKSQRSGTGLFNQKFVIFDVLVWDSKYLIGSTFEERQAILDEAYTTTAYDGFIEKINDTIYRACNFRSNFPQTWNKLVAIEMYEGLVLKRGNAELTPGLSAANNTGWQTKCRKSTKNYSY